MVFPLSGRNRQDRTPLGLISITAIAILLGIIIVTLSVYFEEDSHKTRSVVLELLKEFGIVLTSVFGVSLFYEKFIAERHFSTFHANLRTLISQGESNSAVCEGLGIIQIFRKRGDFDAKNALSAGLNNLSENGSFRAIGRSLVFTVYGWHNFQAMLNNGARLELCMISPNYNAPILGLLAGYSPLETQFAVQRIQESILPWLESSKPIGSLHIRFHDFPLLDSMSEIHNGSECRVVWDVNFGEGLEARQLFYLDGEGVLGRHLRESRYNLIWDHSEEVFVYSNQTVHVNVFDKHQKPALAAQ